MELLLATCEREVFYDGSRGVLARGDAACPNQPFWGEYASSVQCVYMDPPFFTGQDFFYRREKQEGARHGYADRWDSVEDYLSMLRGALKNAHGILKQDGLIFVHVDYRTCAHVRLLLDEIFGAGNFLNEIIWRYKSGGRSKKYFARKHDTIFLYSKSRDYYFDVQSVGVKRGRTARNHLKKAVDESGRVYFSIHSMGKEYRYYEDDLIFPDDVWEDIPHLQQKDPERTGYDTQKPEKLLRRIIACASREGDLVADLFCGSGTTPAAAFDLGRRFFALDRGDAALAVTRRRLAARGAAFAAPCCPASGQPSLRLRVLEEEDSVVLSLEGYCAGRGGEEANEQNRQLVFSDIGAGQALTFGKEDVCDTRQLVSIAGGYLIGGVFYADTFCVRGRHGLETSLHIRRREGNLGVKTEDIFGNEYVFQIISN